MELMYRKDSRSDGSGLCGNKGSEAILKGIVVVSIYGKTESYPQTNINLMESESKKIGVDGRMTNEMKKKWGNITSFWLQPSHPRP